MNTQNLKRMEFTLHKDIDDYHYIYLNMGTSQDFGLLNKMTKRLNKALKKIKAKLLK